MNEAHPSASDAPVWAFAALLGAAAVLGAAQVADWGALQTDVYIAWPILAGLFILFEVYVFHLPFGRSAYTFSLSEIPLFLALFALSPLTALTVRAGGAAIGLTLARVRGVKLAFGVVTTLIDLTVAIAVHRAVLGDGDPLGLRSWIACAAAGLAISVISPVAITIAISLKERSSALAMFPRMFTTGLVNVLANTSVAIVALIVVAHDPWATLALAPVIAALMVAWRAWTMVHRRLEHLQLTHEFIGALGSARDPGTTMSIILRETANLLRAGYVEIAITENDEIVAIRLDGDRLVSTPGRPAWWPAVVPGETLLLVGPRHLDLRRRSGLGLREGIVVGLPPTKHGSISGIFVADRIDDVSTFDDDDVQMLELLAGHANVRIAADGLLEAVRAEGAEKEYQSLHDYLTGLPNRRHFMERTVEALARHQTLAVLVMDLDRFKQVNDTLGHSAGDRVLIAAASRLVGQLSVGAEAMIGRLGGDEFAVLLPGIDTLGAVDVANGLHAALAEPLALDGLSIEIGASIGAAIAPVHGTTAEALLQRADVAMYVAKQSQQGVEVYNPDRDENDVRGLALVTELRHDLDADDLDVHYQPLVDLQTGVVHGVECLVRWSSASYGPIAPDEFIPMAETTGLINLLTERVLARSLAQCAAWRSRGIDLGVSVNVSPRNLVAGDLVRLVTGCLDDTGVPATALTLELTESCLVGDVVATAAILEELRDRGVRISIDDFGTGYSSLSYLSRLPVDEVKIDRSFVQAIGTGSTAIVRAATHLAHELGLEVVAEGVEDVDTWRALADLGCDTAQGYLVSRPQSAQDLTAWLGRHTSASGPPRVELPGIEADAGEGYAPVAPVRLLRPAAND